MVFKSAYVLTFITALTKVCATLCYIPAKSTLYKDRAMNQDNLPVRFFRSSDYGSFVPYHFHPALELIFLTQGKIKVEIPSKAQSNACSKCALPCLPTPLPSSITELKHTHLSFSEPFPEISADLPNQCLLDAQGANFVLINSNELHNYTCTSYNEAYVLQIPEHFLKQELNYQHSAPLRFDLKRATPDSLELIAQYFLELTVAHEFCQDKLGFKVHFNHGLYGILACLMEIIVPSESCSTPNQIALHKHADQLLETEPVNAPIGQTTIIMPNLESSAYNITLPNQSAQQIIGQNHTSKLEVFISDQESSWHGYLSDPKSSVSYLNEDEEKVTLALNKNMNLRRIQPVLDYLKVHYHEQIRLQDMASLINLHPRYFCRIFKEAVGMSLLSYVAELRLCHVYNDLTDDKTTIATIMHRHGYSDSKQFYRSFKARFKLTPKEVRNRLKAL